MKFSKTTFSAIGLLFLLCSSSVVMSQQAQAATGDLAGTVNFSQDCQSGIGVGVTFDGTYLWYTCYGSNPDLLRADPVTGAVSASYNIKGGLGAVAYDSANNVIYAGHGGGSDALGDIEKIQLDAGHNVVTTSLLFNTPDAADTIIDGVGYDGQTHLLYISPDVSPTIYVYNLAGVEQTTFAAHPANCGNSGVAIGGSLLFEGFNGCNHVFVVDKVTKADSFDFTTAVSGDPNFRDEGLSCDTKTFAPKQVMWSQEAYDNNFLNDGSKRRAHAFEIPAGTCGVGGQPSTPGNPVGGTIIPVDMTALFVAGAMTNAVWMIPTLGGITGAVIALFKVKRKHN